MFARISATVAVSAWALCWAAPAAASPAPLVWLDRVGDPDRTLPTAWPWVASDAAADSPAHAVPLPPALIGGVGALGIAWLVRHRASRRR